MINNFVLIKISWSNLISDLQKVSCLIELKSQAKLKDCTSSNFSFKDALDPNMRKIIKLILHLRIPFIYIPLVFHAWIILTGKTQRIQSVFHKITASNIKTESWGNINVISHRVQHSHAEDTTPDHATQK